MKKWMIAFLSLLTACSAGGVKQESNNKIKVLSTTAIVGDLVGAIGGERIDHLILMTGDIDPHSYELVKGDDEKFSAAKIIFSNGIGLEHGASIRYQLQHHPMTAALGDYIFEKHPEKIIYVDGQKDPHIWMDLSLWAEAIPLIVERLSQVDPAGEEFYAANGKRLFEKIELTDRAIDEKLRSVPPEKRYLVTSHDAFNYFARRYLSENEEEWQERFVAPEGLAPDGQLSASDIRDVAEHLVKYQINTLFAESNVSRDALKKIVKVCLEKGHDVKMSKEVLYGDVLGPKGSGAEDYLSMVEHNAALLVSKWKGDE
jgi:manganese/zinc/iron transport system substrate-binding protein